VHSFNGVNSVSLSGWSYSNDEIMLKATKELPEFPFNEDMNSGYHLRHGESLHPIGAPSPAISVTLHVLGWTQWTIGNGARSSSAVSYLGPEYIKRPNLAVLLHARVLRLGQTKSSSSNIAFREVQFTQDAGGMNSKYIFPLLIHFQLQFTIL
jgi:choline dehydrogenase-like flavoprotein